MVFGLQEGQVSCSTHDYSNSEQVEVLDVLMGSGKTYASLRYIEEMALANKNARWIFCTEFLDEIETRTQENEKAKHLWATPTNEEGNKLDSLIELLKEPNKQLIAVTHKLLIDASRSPEFKNLITRKEYCLFLDETVDLINPYDGIKLGEFMWHLQEKRLTVDPKNYGRVKWIDDSVQEFSKGELAVDRLRNEEERIYAAINGKQLSIVTMEDRSFFTVFFRVIISTYQFEHTFMAAYLKIMNIDWVECTDIVCERFTSKADIKEKITMITKYDPQFKNMRMSSTWYESKAVKEDFSLLNNTIRNIGDSYGCKGNPSLLGYTLPKSSLGKQTDKKKIQPKGYPHTKCLVDEEGNEIEGTHDKARSGHIPCNARASNEYASKTVMVHAYDRHPQLITSNYLDFYEVDYSKERYAINELVQWLWRSAIRNGQPIHVAILSKRMRGYFSNWIES